MGVSKTLLPDALQGLYRELSGVPSEYHQAILEAFGRYWRKNMLGQKLKFWERMTVMPTWWNIHHGWNSNLGHDFWQVGDAKHQLVCQASTEFQVLREMSVILKREEPNEWAE